MTAYDVTVAGCDDTTRVFGIEFDEVEHAAVSRLVVAANAATDSGCQPTMSLVTAAEPPADAFCQECLTVATADEGLSRNRNGEWCHARCVEAAVSG